MSGGSKSRGKSCDKWRKSTKREELRRAEDLQVRVEELRRVEEVN